MKWHHDTRLQYLHLVIGDHFICWRRFALGLIYNALTDTLVLDRHSDLFGHTLAKIARDAITHFSKMSRTYIRNRIFDDDFSTYLQVSPGVDYCMTLLSRIGLLEVRLLDSCQNKVTMRPVFIIQVHGIVLPVALTLRESRKSSKSNRHVTSSWRMLTRVS